MCVCVSPGCCTHCRHHCELPRRRFPRSPWWQCPSNTGPQIPQTIIGSVTWPLQRSAVAAAMAIGTMPATNTAGSARAVPPQIPLQSETCPLYTIAAAITILTRPVAHTTIINSEFQCAHAGCTLDVPVGLWTRSTAAHHRTSDGILRFLILFPSRTRCPRSRPNSFQNCPGNLNRAVEQAQFQELMTAPQPEEQRVQDEQVGV